MRQVLAEMSVLFSYPKHLVMLVVRFVLAYGFATPALLKINDLEGTQKWFESMSIPFPILSSFIVSGIETIGIVLLVLGLFTRHISILLGFIMVGAMIFVHAPHGFSVVANGIEIPLYYFIFLTLLASHGAGKYSLDSILFKDGQDVK